MSMESRRAPNAERTKNGPMGFSFRHRKSVHLVFSGVPAAKGSVRTCSYGRTMGKP